jgi:hypothetical protein
LDTYVHMHPWKNVINYIAVPFGIVPKMHGSDCCFSKFIFLEAPQTVYNRFLRKCILQIVCNNITDSGKKKCAFHVYPYQFLWKNLGCVQTSQKNVWQITLQFHYKFIGRPWLSLFHDQIHLNQKF